MTKDAYYFSHDANAHKDPKILKLRSKHGWEGYGIYWAIIETLREQNDYKWLADDKQLLTFSFSNGDETVDQVLEDCLEIGLLTIDDDEYIHSESLTRRMKMKEEIADKRREAGRKGGKKSKGKASDKQLLEQSSSKESKGKETKENKEIPYSEIINYLNEKTDKKFKPTAKQAKEKIKARWNQGYEVEDFKKVIDVCTAKWKGQTFSNGALGDDFLQPSTLFNQKFEERLHWSVNKQNGQSSNQPKYESNSVDLSDEL